MGKQLPDKLVDLLREMRSKGVSLNGLREATGLSKDTIIRYTSPEIPPEPKWTPKAIDYLRTNYPPGESMDDLTAVIHAITGRTDITQHAVKVKIGQLKLLRDQPNNQAKGVASREYWDKWRQNRSTS